MKENLASGTPTSPLLRITKLSWFLLCPASYLLLLPTWQHPQSKHTGKCACRFCNPGFTLPPLSIWIISIICLVSFTVRKSEKQRQKQSKGWENWEAGMCTWWGLKRIPAVQKPHKTLNICVILVSQESRIDSMTGEQERKWRTKHKGTIYQEQERERGKDYYADCLPHPLLALFFFPCLLLLLHYSPKKHCFSAQNRIAQHSPLQHRSPSAKKMLRPIGATPELLHQ